MSHNPSTTDPFVARMPIRNRGTINLADAIGRRLKAALRFWQKQRAVRTLHELDDWTLNDIGLTRNEIPRVVDDIVAAAPPLGDSEEPNQTRTNRHVQTNDVKKSGPVWDVYQSWRDF